MEERTFHRQIQAIPASDLQELCRELGIRQIGRKEELQRRVIMHLQGEEGSHRCLRSGGSQLLRSFLRVLCLSMPILTPPPVPSDPGLSCVCGGMAEGSTLLQCTRCLSFQHRYCIGAAAAMKVYECPLCQMRQMDPFQQAMDVVLGATLCLTNGCGISQKQFIYRQEMHTKLLEPGLHRMVQIRCVRLDGDGYMQHWPKECSILVNGRTIHTVSVQQPTAPRKRRDVPLNIGTLSPGSHNQAMILKQREEDVYAFGIFVIEKASLSDVYNHFLYERVLTPEAGRSFVQSLTCASEDVLSEASRQSLKCPLTRLMPDVPARGWLCRHIQCFDLYAYVVMQAEAKANKWRCPICFAVATHVVVDRFMGGIIDRAKELPGCETVEFQPNGLYRLIVEDVAEGSDDDDELPGIGIKREPDIPFVEMPVKKLKLCARRLLWEDFNACKDHAGNVTEEVMRSAECYQYAVQVRLHGVAPRIEHPIPPKKLLELPSSPVSHGVSSTHPIEIG